ncbi:hypothetical protein MPSEU_000179200 [Mayamaea pseudoterrestris]|nr:hypothetical protein MPSEU_000179200 [Mayamaea pseudoterrestris]
MSSQAPPSWATPSPVTQTSLQPSQAAPQWAQPIASQPQVASADDHMAELFRPYSTLDEPVSETIMRDVRAVYTKLKIVLRPLDRRLTLSPAAMYSMVSTSSDDPDNNNNNNNNTANAAGSNANTSDNQLSENDRQVINELKDWDLWGPLILCLILGVVLSFKAPTNQASIVFASVFVTAWAGSTIVTMNAQLLGGTISFFQSLCVLGYSNFPLVLAASAIGIMRIFVHTWMWIDMIIVSVGFLWAIRTSSVFMSLYVKPERRLLALYPVFFFYVFMSWLILLF